MYYPIYDKELYDQRASIESTIRRSLPEDEKGAKIVEDSFDEKGNRVKLPGIINSLWRNDTLIVYDFLSLASSGTELAETIDMVCKKGATLIIASEELVLDTNTKYEALVGLIRAVAKVDKVNVGMRLKRGRKAYRDKTDNPKDHRTPVYSEKELDDAVMLLKIRTYKEVVALTGISRSTLYLHKKKMQKAEKRANRRNSSSY